MACANHPDVPEVTRCAQCGRRLCQDCFVTLDGEPVCGTCKGRRVRAVERGDLASGRRREPSPWEKRKSLGTLFETLQAVLFHPTEFFRGLAPEGQGAWSYIVAVGWPAIALAQVTGFLVQIAILSFAGGRRSPMSAAGGLAGLGFLVGFVVVAPLGILVGTALRGALAHLFLRICGGANARLEASLRVAAYAQSPLVFNWIPIVGPFVGAIWDVVIFVIGLREMHETSYARVIASVLIPVVVCLAVILIPIIFLMFARGIAK